MVYILHFDKPFKHARHYVGYCEDSRFEDRMNEHRKAKWADSYMGKVNAQGIRWKVARVIPNGDENLERRIKFIWKRTAALCPCCTDKPRQITVGYTYQVSELQMWERYWDAVMPKT